MNKISLKIAHIIITGKVQGVSYRWLFRKVGIANNLIGWVRNITSNRVEAEILGKEEDINKMINKCKEGPPLAEVNDVIVNFIDKISNVNKDIKDIKILESK